jgi:enoyl-CoA hydratase/carnithine racemase
LSPVAGAVRSEPLGDLRLLVIDRPEKRNALSRAMIEQARAAVAEAVADVEVRGIVIAGAGPSFSAGVDLYEFAEGTPESARQLIIALKDLCAAVRLASKPVACALHGHCLGGALELAAAADLRVAAPDARLGMPEVGLGLPSVIDAVLLERHVGVGRAHELILTGDLITGEEAYSWGLVNRLAPATEVVDAAALLLGRVTRHGLETIAAQKQLFAEWLERPLSEAIDASVEPLVDAFVQGRPQATARRLLSRGR